MIELTDEQKARIAENRAKALQRFEERKKRLATEDSLVISNLQKNPSKIISAQIQKSSNFFSNAPPNKKISNNALSKPKAFEENNFNSNNNSNRPSYIPVVKVNFIIADLEYIKVNLH